MIQGTRLKVSHIYREHIIYGKAPAEIVATCPSLTLSDVYGALAYAFAHLGEIRKELLEERNILHQIKKTHLFKKPVKIHT